MVKDVVALETCEVISSADAIKWLNKNWGLEHKMETIYSPYFHFSNKIMNIKSFNYVSYDENDYYSAYNDIEHNRNKNLRKATLYID